eukprot:GDKJ01031021.1.p1 GENE.GDKJ01031021.1~~GDKJ01031021.1.p1  ORF type:complete len:527 (-),score=126.00 GDKJ01031021.1:227-1606(-)
MRIEYNKRLVERQSKIMQLYLNEDAQWKIEMQNMQETPEQRMERLAQRAWELKSKREEERLRYVNEKKYQQWRMGEDTLRVEDSKLAELETLIQRDQQVYDKQLMKRQELREEEMYDALIQKTYERMVDRECQEIADRARKNSETKAVMDKQVELTRQRRAQEFAQFLKERAETVEQTERDRINGEERVRREEEDKRRKRLSMDAFIREQREERVRNEQHEKDEDKKWIQSVLAREAEAEGREALERERQRQATKEFRAAMALELQRQSENEAEVERLQFEEAERQWAQRQAVWDEHERNRIRLLEDVYAGRADQVHFKEAERQKISALSDEERARERAEFQRVSEIDEHKRAIEQRNRWRLQEELFRQMDFHQIQRQRETQLVHLERRKAQIAEDRLKEALDEEKSKQQKAREHIRSMRENQSEMIDSKVTGVLPSVANKRSYPVAPVRHVSLAPWEK